MINEVLTGVAHGIFAGFTGKEQHTLEDGNKSTVASIATQHGHGVGDAIRVIYQKIVEDNKKEHDLTPKQTEDVIVAALDKVNDNQSKRTEANDTAKRSHEEALLKEIADNTKAMLESDKKTQKEKTEVTPLEKPKVPSIPTKDKDSPAEVEPKKPTKDLIKEIVKETVIGKSTSELAKGGMLGRFAADAITKAVLEKTSVVSALGSTIKSRAESGGAIGKILSVVHDAYKEQAEKIDSAQVTKKETQVVAGQKSTTETVTKDRLSEALTKPEATRPVKTVPLVTSSGLTIAPHKKTKLAMELMTALSSQPRNRLSTIPMANARSPILAAAKNISGIEQPTTQQEQQVEPQQEKESGGGLLSTLANVASIATVLPKVGAMLPGLAAAGTTALAAGGVAAAGAAGYGLGTLIQPGLDKAFGGESGSIGSRIYDWLNPSVDSGITAPVPARSVQPPIVSTSVASPPVMPNPTSIQSEINTAMGVSDALSASKAAQQSQPIVIQQPASNTQQESGGVNKIVSIRNADSSFERVQMNDYWPTRIA